MKNTNLNVIPGVGLGGYKLASHISEYPIDLKAIKVANLQTIVELEDEAIFLLLDRDQRIIQISGLEGYKGTLDGRFFIGQKLADILESGWFYAEDIAGFLHKKFERVILRCQFEDAEAFEIERNIDRLSVTEIDVVSHV